jgi:membrane protease YdiL (CAAX protease family)
MLAERRPQRPSTVLFAVLALALAVGAAASLIAGSASAPAFHPGPTATLFLTSGQLAVVSVLAGIALIGIALWVNSGTSRVPIPGRAAVTLCMVILIGILFVVLVHAVALSGGPLLTTPTNHSVVNGTGSSGNGTLPTNASAAGGPLDVFSLRLPPWAPFAGVAVAALVVGAIAIPAWGRRDGRTGGRHRPGESSRRAEVRAALRSAAHQLDEGEEPRAVVIRLYGALLERVGPVVGGVDGETPEEIRALHLVQLGIRPEAATTLTRLFEEARYSTHPMGPGSASRATEAIRNAGADLDRPRPGT